MQKRMINTGQPASCLCLTNLLQHKCMQAINLDGGSSAMLWFDGEYVTQSSSSPLRYTGGRPLPNAWVYG